MPKLPCALPFSYSFIITLPSQTIGIKFPSYFINYACVSDCLFVSNKVVALIEHLNENECL